MTDYIPDDWPEAEGELPPSLEYLLGRFIDAIRGFTESLKKNPSTLMTWYNSFRQAIVSYIQAAFMAGQRSEYIGETERGIIYDYVKAQVEYLNNFRLVIQSADEWNNQWDARAESYARGIVSPYWKGRTKYLPLPAMPGDGSTDCGQMCACLWDVRIVDEEAGDYDCYWMMNASRIVKTEHCQDCLTRSIIWNPLKIRGNELTLEPTQIPEGYIAPDLLKYQEYIETALKHLPGQHDQKRHGRRGSAESGSYNVVTETDSETAKILVTQGLEPSFKPIIAEGYEYAPGIGLEREGTYVADPSAFTRGSFGNVRIHMDISEDNLTIPREQSQLGVADIKKALSNENGAITKGRISPKTITKIEVHEGNQWKQYTRDEYIKKNGLSNIPELPSVSSYRASLEKNKTGWRLRDDQIDDLVFDYNRGGLFDKINLAQEVGLVD